ncbi:MAG: hypothetical protein Q4F79_05140 [Eubacteriales bacterium]|nr:hypothetical protein [Eubacteriales bacterium]
MNERIKVLVLGNECFSNSNSNGRTLKNFFLGWPKSDIAQFYIHEANPDNEVCENYFQVSDQQALYAFLNKNYSPKASDTTDKLPNARTPKGRNALTMLARTIIWDSGKWKKSGFNNWIDSFSPNVIVVQAGDSPFIFKLARLISTKKSIPIVIYNSENFYFKDYDYFRSDGVAHLMYPLFKVIFRRQLRLLIRKAYMSIYICEKLEEDYKIAFNKPSRTIYTATEMSELRNVDHEGFVVSYLGNMGVGRHRPLIEIGETLQMISKDYHLDVYGSVPSKEIEEQLKACNGIRLKGFVSYEKVIEVMEKSDVLVHAEDFEPFYRKGLKRAFSTKIADTLASGKCFLLYAPEEVACADYLKNNQAAYVVNDRSRLYDVLAELSSNNATRERYKENALRVVKENHNAKKNAELFQEIIRDAVRLYRSK